MFRQGSRFRWPGFLALAVLILVLGMSLGHPRPSRGDLSGHAPGDILQVISVGGVLTADGTIWQYRPDKGRWMTVDEGFKDQGKETHILPLPVPADSIRQMITFGFLVTNEGDCWLYDLESNQWEKLPPPRS